MGGEQEWGASPPQGQGSSNLTAYMAWERMMNNEETVPSQWSSESSGETVIERLIEMQCNASI